MHRRPLALAALLLALLPGVAVASKPGPIVGLGEQQASMFRDPHYLRLGLHDARYVVPWDAFEDPYRLRLLDDWMAAARAAHTRPLIGFVHSARRASVLPSARRFAGAFKRFRARYPDVRQWIPWNEANSPGALTEFRPARAARYFDVVMRNCRGCRVVAADLLDTRALSGWIQRFTRAARYRPRIWGLHNYSDANGFRDRGTRTLLALTRGNVWFTETGGVLLRHGHRNGKVVKVFRHSPQDVARTTAHILALSCISPRIKRVYVYNFVAPAKVTGWDSGLLDSRGRPRPAFGTLRRALDRSAAGGHPGRVTC
jgi:hypothetical protein